MQPNSHSDASSPGPEPGPGPLPEGGLPRADLPFSPKVGLFDDEIETRSQAGLRWILASGLVLVLGVGGWLAYRSWQRQTIEPVLVSTGQVTRRTLENRVDATGIVTLGNQQTLKAPADVTVEAVLVAERQRVAEGTVLLRLRDRSLERQLDEELIQSDILQLQQQRQQEVLQDRQRNVQRAADRLGESQTLLDQGYISEDEFDRDREALESSQSELREAQVSLQQSDLEIRKNQATLANIRAQIGDNAILAPFDAVVLNIDVQPGDGVQSEGNLLTIGDPGQERILFDLITLDANQVSVNMPVRVSIIGPDPEPYRGRVISIAPQAVGNSEGSSGQATVGAIAQLDRPSGTLIPGGSVSLEVILTQRPDALSLPSGAVHEDSEGPSVWVVDEDNKVQKRPVVTGLNTLDAVEIISGLAENDPVILTSPPDQPLVEGMVVTTEPPASGPGEPGSQEDRSNP